MGASSLNIYNKKKRSGIFACVKISHVKNQFPRPPLSRLWQQRLSLKARTIYTEKYMKCFNCHTAPTKNQFMKKNSCDAKKFLYFFYLLNKTCAKCESIKKLKNMCD